MSYTPTLVDGMDLSMFSEAIRKVKRSCRGNGDCLAIQRAHLVEELETAGKPKEWVRMVKKVFEKSAKKHQKTPDSIEERYTLPHNQPIGGVGGDPSPEERAKVVEGMAALRQQFATYMRVTDEQALDITLAIVVGHFWKGRSPGWLLVVGPASSGKTEYIDTLTLLRPLVYELSDVTEKTWASGLSAEDAVGGVPPSLLDKYPNNIFTYKDLTTMLSKRPEGRVATFGQFTEIFDGKINKSFGTGFEFHWEGYATMLMGVTQLIYNQHAILGLLGPRFLLMRLRLGDDIEDTDFALGVDLEEYYQQKQKMREMTKQFIDSLPHYQPSVPKDIRHLLSVIGTVIAKARSSPKRDHEGDIEMTYEAEKPLRVAQQLMRVAQALAVLHGKLEVDMDEIGFIMRLAFDTILPVRAHILSKLFKENELGTGQLRGGMAYGESYVQLALSDMKAFGVVQHLGEQTESSPWALTPKFRSYINEIGGFDTYLSDEPVDPPKGGWQKG